MIKPLEAATLIGHQYSLYLANNTTGFVCFFCDMMFYNRTEIREGLFSLGRLQILICSGQDSSHTSSK